MKVDETKAYLKVSLIYTIVAAVTPALQLLIQPIIEGKDRLLPIEFGKLSIGEGFATFFFIFIVFGYNAGLVRYFYDYQQSKLELNKLISTVFSRLILRGLISVGILFLLLPFGKYFFEITDLQEIGDYGFLALIIGFSRAINITSCALYRNERRVKMFVITSLGFSLVRIVGILISLFYYEWSFIGYMLGNAIGGSLVSVLILIYLYLRTGFSFSREMNKHLFHFSSPVFITGLVSWALLFADRWFLQYFTSGDQLAIYDTALKFCMGIDMLIIALNGANQPEVFSNLKENTKESLKKVASYMHLFMLQSNLLILSAILPIMLYLTMFYETELKLAACFIPFIMSRYILKSQSTVYSLPLYYHKKTTVFIYANLISLGMNILLNYLLVPNYGIYGAIVATIISSAILLFILRWKSVQINAIKWNESKVLFYPLLFVVGIILLEILKIQFDLNLFLMASLVVFLMVVGNVGLYWKQVKGIYNKRFSR